jgi:hypothetical protein
MAVTWLKLAVIFEEDDAALNAVAISNPTSSRSNPDDVEP